MDGIWHQIDSLVWEWLMDRDQGVFTQAISVVAHKRSVRVIFSDMKCKLLWRYISVEIAFEEAKYLDIRSKEGI